MAAVVIVHLTACSKSVEWEEEVPLNTGDTIWVKRSATYSLQGGAGNPLDLAYRPERNEVIEFIWKGKRYRYEGDARVMLLAIAPDQTPSLVARAADNGWNFVHHYECTLPFYVQLVPKPDGLTWTWSPSMEKWLYNLRTNLLLNRRPPQQMNKQYTTEQRSDEDSPAASRTPSIKKIDPDYVGDICRNSRRK